MTIRALSLALVFASACAPLAPMTASDGGCEAGAPVLEGDVSNGRDLGGLTAGASATKCGQLFRTAALNTLNPEGCTRFAQLGIKTVIDLRVATERQGSPNAACIEPGARQVIAPMPIPYNVSPADYLADLHEDAAVKTVFDTLGDAANYPVLFHCTYGRDRTGITAALVLLTLGVSREEIRRDYQRTAENGIRTTPASLDAALDEIDRLGGVEAHLGSIGVSPASLATLRARTLQ